THTTRKLKSKPTTTPAVAAPASAPPLKSACRRNSRRDSSPSAAVAATFMTTSTSPPDATAPRKSTQNPIVFVHAATAPSSAAQVSNAIDSTVRVPCRSARTPPLALATLPPNTVPARSNPSCASRNPRNRCTSKATTAQVPPQNPHQTHVTRLGRSRSVAAVRRLVALFAFVVAVAACSSGHSKSASTTTATTTTSPTAPQDGTLFTGSDDDFYVVPSPLPPGHP